MTLHKDGFIFITGRKKNVIVLKNGKNIYPEELELLINNLPYVAQSALVGNLKDLYEKSEKAIYTEGPTFVAVLSPCPRGWGYPSEDLQTISKLAVDTCFWPLYEVENGKYKITYKPAKKLPVEEFLKMQKRYRHVFKPGNEWMIEEIQKEVDKKWEYLQMMEKITND